MLFDFQSFNLTYKFLSIDSCLKKDKKKKKKKDAKCSQKFGAERVTFYINLKRAAIGPSATLTGR